MDVRILIVSNDALSDCNANGRTMKNLIFSISKENLAQFYIHGTPDADACAHYFGVSDTDALSAFLHKKKTPTASQTATPGKKHARNYRNLVLRNMVWQSMQWQTKAFTDFLETFRPEIVLLQAGDAPFMYKIARRIAKKYAAKLVMFNTENYVLKKRMYAARPNDNLFWHGILMRSLKRQYKKFMDRADYCIYNTEHLEECYQTAYPHPGKSAVFYTVSEMPALPAKEDETFSLLYCGNLGVGRVAPLCQMAEVLYKVAPDARLDIYGSFANEDEKALLCALPNVYYGGIVPYSQIPELMQKASLLVHCENPERLENLKGAFSTKIADSLACGRPFLVYADRAYPFVQYLMKYDCAHIAATPEELKSVLQQCIGDRDYRYRFIPNALKTAKTNHNSSNNCEKITDVFAHIMK